jgi:glutamate racemase
MFREYKTPRIGIFDSGIGGLAIAKELLKNIGNAEFIYVADSAFMPYGNKDKKIIIERSLKITQFFLDQSVDIIVVACNTSESIALPKIKQLVGKKAVVASIIDPVVEVIATEHCNEKIAILATPNTINTGAFNQKIKSKCNSANLTDIAAPELAIEIEKKYADQMHNVEKICDSALQNLEKNTLLVLACTHYLHIKNYLEKLGFKVIDSAKIIGETVAKKIPHIMNSNTKKVQIKYYCTLKNKDFVNSFKNIMNEEYIELNQLYL